MHLKLEFRATQHGFNIDSLHRRILNREQTIIFIKNEFNQVFGAYSKIPFENKGEYKYDEVAFIFSLTKKTKHHQIFQEKKAVFHSKDRLFYFGDGEIAIWDKCNIHN